MTSGETADNDNHAPGHGPVPHLGKADPAGSPRLLTREILTRPWSSSGRS
jgi:hypothetical protein